jgi:hypothetical protein
LPAQESEDLPVLHRPTEADGPSRGRRHPLVPGAGAALAISAIQLLFMFCLSYVPLQAEPKDMPLGVSGPEPAVTKVTHQLAVAGDDAFDIKRYQNADEARSAIEKRKVYAAIAVSPDSMLVLVSSAANNSVATMIRNQVAKASTSGSLRIEDVVPASHDDPNGSGYLATALPLTLLSLALGILVALLEKRHLHSAAWIAIAATTTSAGATCMVHAFGIFTGGYWGTIGILALLIFGIAATSAGLTHLGKVGRMFDLAFALTLLCIGIPGAGALAPSVFLVEPWRTIGPLLPPGAAVDVLRGINFFDGIATAGPLCVLLAWACIGSALIVGPYIRRELRPTVTSSSDADGE